MDNPLLPDKYLICACVLTLRLGQLILRALRQIIRLPHNYEDFLKLFNACIILPFIRIMQSKKLTQTEYTFYFFLGLFNFDLLWNTGDFSQYPVYVASGYLSLTLVTTQLGRLVKIIINLRGTASVLIVKEIIMIFS